MIASSYFGGQSWAGCDEVLVEIGAVGCGMLDANDEFEGFGGGVEFVKSGG